MSHIMFLKFLTFEFNEGEYRTELSQFDKKEFQLKIFGYRNIKS